MHHDLLWIGAAKDPGETGGCCCAVFCLFFFFFYLEKKIEAKPFFFVWGGVCFGGKVK